MVLVDVRFTCEVAFYVFKVGFDCVMCLLLFYLCCFVGVAWCLLCGLRLLCVFVNGWHYGRFKFL